MKSCSNYFFSKLYLVNNLTIVGETQVHCFQKCYYYNFFSLIYKYL